MSTCKPTAADAVPVHSASVERGLIACALAAPEAAAVAFGNIVPEDLYVPQHRELWRALRPIFEKCGSLENELLVKVELEAAGVLPLVSGIEALGRHYNNAASFTGTECEDFIQQVKELAVKRALQDAAGRIQAGVQRGDPLPELLHHLDAIRSVAAPSGPRTIGDWLKCPAMRERETRLTSGYPDLDHALDGGFMPGGLYVLSGPTGKGKSTLLRNIGRRAALTGVRTLLVTLEDRPVQAVRKILSASAHVPVKALERLAFEPEQSRAIAGATDALADLPLAVDGDTNELSKLEALLSAFSQDGGKLALIDQASWIVAPGETALDRATAISRRLKQAARDSGLVIMLAAQVNREGSKRDDGPTLYDLRDSGSYEQDADGVLMVKSVDSFLDGRPAVVNLEVAKHRHGAAGGIIRFCWFEAEARVESYNPAEIASVSR